MQMTADGRGIAVEGLCQQLQRNGSLQGFGIDIVGQGFIDCEGTFAKLLTIRVTDSGIQMKSLGTGRLRTDLRHHTPPHIWDCMPVAVLLLSAHIGQRVLGAQRLPYNNKSKICARYEQEAWARHDKA